MKYFIKNNKSIFLVLVTNKSTKSIILQ